MPPLPVAGPEPQPERLRDHLDQVRREVQAQQQPGLLQRLVGVQPSRAHQKLQPRPVPLGPAPGEPPNRLTTSHRHRTEIPHRCTDLVARVPPRSRPTRCPIRTQTQDAAELSEAGIAFDQVIPRTVVRPQLRTQQQVDPAGSAPVHRPIQASRALRRAPRRATVIRSHSIL